MLRVLDLFSGMGAFEKSLSRLGIEHEVVATCEIDPYPIYAYELIHDIPRSRNLGDITKINIGELPGYDLLVGGSPCTNISELSACQVWTGMAGIHGEESGLFFNYADILNTTLPRYFVFENVDNLLDSNNGRDWGVVYGHLSRNYNVTYGILDAQDFIVPQSRKRVFAIGIRKDIDQRFIMPVGRHTWLRVNDILIPIVDGSYYLSDKALDYMNRETSNGRNHWEYCYHSYYNGISKCLIKSMYKGVPHGIVILRDGTPRRYTPLECFRLMGYDDADYYKVHLQISASRLYKMLGNSIAVTVLDAISINLLMGGKYNEV